MTTTNHKRANCISWDDYFMGMAFLSAKKSDCIPREGACIINLEKRIVGMGFTKMLYDAEIHAEMDAIMNKTIVNLKDCTMYVTSFPCQECMKLIIQSGIKEIVCKTIGETERKLYSRFIELSKYDITGEVNVKFTCYEYTNA